MLLLSKARRMLRQIPLGKGFWLFLLRNLILYFLLFNAYLHFRQDLSLAFLSAAFALAVFLALWMERGRLRFLPALLAVLAAPLAIRGLFFLAFGFQRRLAPGPESDFLYFFFDKDFFPSLLPFLLVWVFNFAALRYPSFAPVEPGLNALFLMAIFWMEAGYKISLYPHPSLFASALFIFIFGEVAVLMLARAGASGLRTQTAVTGGGREASRGGSGRTSSAGARPFLSFIWLIVPLLIILMIYLVGRFNEGAVRQGGGLMKPTLFRFDFSQFIKLESEIDMSDDLVLLFRKEGPAERILLRRFILSGYDRNRGFFHLNRRDLENLPVTVPDSPEELPDPDYLARSEVRQEYFFVNFDPTSLIGMNYPIKVTPLKNWDSSSFLRIYRVLSRVSQAGGFELEEADPSGLSPGQYRIYTDYGGNEKIRELAERITRGTEDYYGKVLAIRDYLKENFYYSLRPGLATDGDQLAHFLFQSHKGYCSYFAFSMALLCRSLGIPARVAVGFFVDPEAEVLNFYEVRAFQAHAWVEVYFGRYGWIEFDPSSTDIAPGEEFILSFAFDLARLSGLIEEILMHQDELEEERAEQLPFTRRLLEWPQDLLRGLAWIARVWYFLLPALYLLFISALKLYPLLLFVLQPERRHKIKHLFRYSLALPYGLGCLRRPDESIEEYAGRMDRERSWKLGPWAVAYLKAVFSDRFSEQDYHHALGAWRQFAGSFQASTPILHRLLAFLMPLNSLKRRG